PTTLHFSFRASPAHLPLHPFPTRRASDHAPEPPQLPAEGLDILRDELRGMRADRERVVLGVNAERVEPDRHSLRELRALGRHARSEEHTSELQSLRHLVCRLLLEKKKKTK